MSDWRESSLEDLADDGPNALATGPFGSAISAKHFVDDGIPVIRGSNLSLDVGVRLNDEGLVFLNEETSARFGRSIARRGDLVFTCWGTVGQVGLVDERCRYDEYVVSNKQMKLTPDPRRVDSHFLYYLLSSPAMVGEVIGQAIGAAVPGFNLGQLRMVTVRVPELTEQRSIAAVLRAIDDLIENNRRRVELLEEMARAIYREWFVRFRYPGHEDVPLVDSPLGPIPDGWRPAAVADVSEAITRGVAPKYDDDGPSLAINQKCIRDGRVSLDKARRQMRPVPEVKRVRRGDLLVNSTGIGTLGRAAICLMNHPALTVDTHVTIVRPALPAANPWFGLCLVGRQVDFEQLGTGSTGQTELSRADIGALKVLVPPEPVRSAFAELVDPQLEAAIALRDENAALASLRDLLLPKLVTGQIDVSHLDLDALTEAATA